MADNIYDEIEIEVRPSFPSSPPPLLSIQLPTNIFSKHRT